MMLIVADSSPLNLLVQIDQVEVLPILFQFVVVPTEVARELSRPRAPEAVRRFIASPPSWIEIREPSHIEPLEELDPGERSAISLAEELHADFVLMDEKAGRRVAAERRLPVIGSIGVLERAADRGLLDLNEAYNRVRRTRFHVSDRILVESLCRHQRRDA